MATLYYEARKRKGMYRGVVYHYSNIPQDGGEVLDYRSKEYSYPEQAIDDAAEWLDDNGYEAELGVSDV